MKLARSIAPFVLPLVGGCSSAIAPTPQTKMQVHVIGSASAADTLPDASSTDAADTVPFVYDGGIGNGLSIDSVPTDGGLCPASPALASVPECAELPNAAYYYADPTQPGVMFGDQGDPISQPLGSYCAADQYLVGCRFDDAGNWQHPPASANCKPTGGDGYIGTLVFCCPCQ